MTAQEALARVANEKAGPAENMVQVRESIKKAIHNILHHHIHIYPPIMESEIQRSNLRGRVCLSEPGKSLS